DNCIIEMTIVKKNVGQLGSFGNRIPESNQMAEITQGVFDTDNITVLHIHVEQACIVSRLGTVAHRFPWNNCMQTVLQSIYNCRSDAPAGRASSHNQRINA